MILAAGAGATSGQEQSPRRGGCLQGYAVRARFRAWGKGGEEKEVSKERVHCASDKWRETETETERE